MSDQDRMEAIQQILNETCGIDKALIRPESKLIHDLGVDSLGMLEAVIEAEEVFGVSINAGDLSPDLTVTGLLDVIKDQGSVVRDTEFAS